LAETNDLLNRSPAGQEDPFLSRHIRFSREDKLAFVVEGGRFEVAHERSAAGRRAASSRDDLKRIGTVGSKRSAWNHCEADESCQFHCKEWQCGFGLSHGADAGDICC